jgi:catechol 2,3-dioxygenase-like lactoylglutathione lyase family enzyme
VLLGIDHLVVVVPDLRPAVRDYEALGFTVVPGGDHPTGTHNALVAFADGAYLELIAFRERRPEHRWWAFAEQGGGLADVCLRTDDLATDAAAFRAAGVALADPVPLSRLRPDGVTVRWRLVIPAPPFRRVAPFLIEDDTPREARGPAAVGHPNGVRGVGTLTVAVEDAARVVAWYEGVTGVRARASTREDLAAHGATCRVGRHAVEILSPTSAAGPLARWLRERGGGPFAVTLAGAGPARVVDVARSQGVRMALAAG